ncbi:uronyl 2-sulfotransferase a isoform X2 [Lepisosteus oculatus]|uniref:uronyl 2-sulfotransferase a isoform X2 n=1 Tax=Lepisosteus oculatus TaxID=7918 RepID=UPI00073FB189|nr:PREDICTED: uronyl 2-sulfotransferase isoform X2 [Lepisosteus oculatus]
MMKNYNSSPRHKSQTSNHNRDRKHKSNWLSVILLRFSLRDYGFCMATLFLFCLGSLFYQLNGGPPKILLDIRQYLGNSTFLDDHGPPVPRVDLIKNISSIPQPFLFTRHVHFLNFRRFRMEQPVYINIIRDPINRFLSNYFFRRFGDWRGEQNHMIRTPGMKDEERYLDINVCILENYPECSNPRLFYIIPYFCGQHPKCREPGVWALERAKQNAVENFLLVGILEELEDVLLILERLLPHFFSDVLNIYKSPGYRKLGNMTGTVRKQTPSLEALQVLYHRMKYEYDFYNFIRDQFHLMKRKIGLKSQFSLTHTPNFLLSSQLKTHQPVEEREEEMEEDAHSWLVQP